MATSKKKSYKPGDISKTVARTAARMVTGSMADPAITKKLAEGLSTKKISGAGKATMKGASSSMKMSKTSKPITTAGTPWYAEKKKSISKQKGSAKKLKYTK